VFDICRFQVQGRVSENVAVNKFKLDYPEEILKKKLEEQRTANKNIQTVLKTIANEHSQFAPIISPLLDI